MRRLALALTSLLTFAAMSMAQPFYKTITVNPTATGGDIAAQNDFPLLVRFTSTSAATGSDVLAGSLANGADVYFTDETGNTPLAFERERWTPTAAEFWVRIPTMNGTTGGGSPVPTIIRVYYGYSNPESDLSNPSAVFDTALGFRAVLHMNGANATDNEVDATHHGFDAVVWGAPAPAAGAIGGSRSLTGNMGFTLGRSQTLRGLHFINSLSGVASGQSGMMMKTTDGGENWTAVRGNTNLAHAFSFNAVDCPTASTCYSAASRTNGANGSLSGTQAANLIVRSTDGGMTWAKQNAADSGGTGNLYGISCNASNSCVAVGGNTTTTRYYKTLSATDGAWSSLQTNTSTTAMLAVSCVVGSNVCFAVGGTNATTPRVAKFTNTDGTWGVADQTTAGSGRLNGVHCVSDNVCYAVGDGGTIVKTADGGSTSWATQTSGTTKNLRAVHCADASTCWAVGNANTTLGSTSIILKTTNGGTSWDSNGVARFTDSLFAVRFTSASNGVIVGGNGTVLRTTNGGTTWALNGYSRKLAYRVNGSYDFDSARAGSLTGDNYTNSAWVYPSANSTTQMSIFGKGDNHYLIQNRNAGGGKGRFEAAEKNFSNNGTFNTPPFGNYLFQNASQGATDENQACCNATDTVRANVWQHVVGVRINHTEGETVIADRESLYVDGGAKCGGTQFVANNTGYAEQTGTPTRFLDAVMIGFRVENRDRYWTLGPIDEVRSEGVRRSADWVCLSYQTQTPDLDAYFGKVVMGSPTSLSRAARNGSNVLQFSGGQYSFAIPAGMAESAELRVIDVFGRTVWSTKVRMDGKAQTVSWNGVAANGSQATAGVYFARLRLVNQGKVTEHALRGSLTH